MRRNLGDELLKEIIDSKLDETYLFDHAGNKVLVSTREIEPVDKIVFLESTGKLLSKNNKSYRTLTVRSIHGPSGHERLTINEHRGCSFAKYCCFQTYE